MTHTCQCDEHVLTYQCPIDCLEAVLSRATFHTLARAYDAEFDPPATVGDAVGLYRQGRLTEIWGLGRRRIGEIGVSLAYLGLIGADEYLAPVKGGASNPR